MSNHLQSPPNTLSNSPKNFKPNQAKSVREKKGWTIFQNLSNGHFSSRGIRPKIFSRVKILKKKNLPFVTKLLTHQSPFWRNGHSKFQKTKKNFPWVKISKPKPGLQSEPKAQQILAHQSLFQKNGHIKFNNTFYIRGLFPGSVNKNWEFGGSALNRTIKH